jgi:hypothetical protein
MATIAKGFDPTYDDMSRYLNYQAANSPQVDSDVSDLEAAIYFFSRKYHLGLDTNLFKAMLKSGHRPNPTHRSVADVSNAAHYLYHVLVGAFIEGA